MHKHYQSGEGVNAPEPVQRAKNLVEEFFGLTLADAEFYPSEFYETLTRGPDPSDYYHTVLISPTGRELLRCSFTHRREGGWVTVRVDGNRYWEKALQVAIDNFVNNPKGGAGVLGDFRPTAEKLNAAR